MLFIVACRGWGYSFSVVRAEDEAQAKRLAGADMYRSVEVIPLPPDGPPAVLWDESESPDTPRDLD